MIFEKVINKFFSDEYNMKNKNVFFIWANENWTNNVSFGNNKDKIENYYNETNFLFNFRNLLPYFKHKNYLKIDNKPVFLLHHPWFLNIKEIELLYNIFNFNCKLNNFDGIHFIINSMNEYYDNFINYNFHFNYKKTKEIFNIDGQDYINYENYTNNIIYRQNEIQTLVFDFDNRPRLYKPNRLHLSKICAYNNIETQSKFIEKTINSYSKSINQINKILLINSWNEWGEKMAVEPSKEKNDFYLNLINKYLKC
jgi:hypothetical protein